MKCGVAHALWPLMLVVLGACSLDKSGLLDLDAAGDDGAPGDDGGGDDSLEDMGVLAADGGEGTDAQEDVWAEARSDGDADGVARVAPESGAGGADAKDDERADRHADASLDVLVPDAPGDSTVDSPSVDAPPDAVPPIDSGPLPIVWDGGAIVDPEFDDSDWISFCVSLVACGQMPSVSACVALLHQPSSRDALIPTPDMVASVNNASPNCRQVRRALGGGLSCPSTTADSCSGNSLVTCRYGFTMTIDCGALGMVCSSGAGNVGCGFGDCSASQEGATYCVGPNYLALCAHGRYEPMLDCQTFGGTCTGPAGTAQCQGTGGTMCTAGASCVGTSIVQCLGGLLGSVDCSDLYDPSFTCVADYAGIASCAGGTSCDPAVSTDTCTQMDEVSFCNVGEGDTYDCTGNGYSGCDAGKCFP